jgi:lipopolysaccharide export system protein LptA
LGVLIALLLTPWALAQLRVDEPVPALTQPIHISSTSARSWTEDGVRILLLEGNVFVEQGLARVRSDRAAAWIHEDAARRSQITRIEIYAEGNVRVQSGRDEHAAPDYYRVFQSRSQVSVTMQERLVGPAVDNPVFQRGEARRGVSVAPATRPERDVQQVTFQESPKPVSGERRLRVFPRYGSNFDADTRKASPTETAVVVTGGVQMILDNVSGIGTVDIATDRMIVWLLSEDAAKATQGGTQPQTAQLELYLEGNVIVRQGGRTIEASEMYYDVARNLAVINQAEVRTFNELIKSPIIVRAEKMRQVAAHKFIAEQASVTTSRFGRPGYRAEVSQVTFEEFPKSGAASTSEPTFDLGLGGTPEPGTGRRITGVDNYFYIDDIPLFYWPYLDASLDDINTPLKQVKFRQDRIFGTQILTTWNMYEVLGFDSPPAGTKWDLHLDYLSDRGPAAGSEFEYHGHDLFGIPGPYWGMLDSYWINDEGKDTLGGTRKNLEPDKQDRGRLLFRHRHELPNDLSLIAEVGYITDRNFLEQYFERQWEEDKDQETLLYLKQQRDNWAWTALARHRLLDFVTTTEYLPQLDFYWLGKSLWDDKLTYFTHTSGGYLHSRPGDFVPDPLGLGHNGGRFDTMHELDLPFYVGPVKVVPFVLGRATAWSDVLDFDSEGRAYGQAGARFSLPLSRVYPCVENEWFNLHGMAHKIDFDIEYSYADTDVSFSKLPLYDELEDDAEQAFRQRFIVRDYAGVLPAELDPQRYAIRRGLMTSAETLDELHVLRAGIRQRLQTKRGLPGRRRIIDWMTLDLEGAYFPDQDRDNFGEDFGLLQYDYAWHIGDRTSILSDGWYETFDDGPRMWSIGLFLDRPPRGSLYLGYRSLEPIGSSVASVSYNYWMSPKYVSSFVTSYDFGEDTNLGQTLVLTRIGADFVFRLALSADPLRDNYGISFELSPRLDPDVHLGSVKGPRIPLEYAPVE